MGLDGSQVERLAIDLAGAGDRNHEKDRKVMLVGANKIKKGMRADFSGHSHAPYIPNAISYDRLSDLGYEIGVDKAGPQGGLGNVLAFGTSHNAPVVDHTAAMTRELPFILRNLGVAAEESVLGGDR